MDVSAVGDLNSAIRAYSRGEPMTATDPTTGELAAMQYVYIESPPHTDAYGPDEVLPQYANLPAPFLDRLAELLANRDSTTCWLCGAGAGYVLTQRGDREVIEWATTALAREGSNPVAVLCEACSPYVPVEPDPLPTSNVADVVHTLRRIAADMRAKIAADDDGSSWGGGAQTMMELLEAEAVKIGNGGPLAPAADRAPCGNPNCACHGPAQTPDLPERTPEVIE